MGCGFVWSSAADCGANSIQFRDRFVLSHRELIKCSHVLLPPMGKTIFVQWIKLRSILERSDELSKYLTDSIVIFNYFNQ